MAIPTTVLLDHTNYCFYRVTATMSWWAHLKDKPPPSMENEEFLNSLEKQYLSHLEKLVKKTRIPMDQIFMVQDCPREGIWRHDHYSGYKGTRPSNSGIGPYIRHLNDKMRSRYRLVIMAERAESDDCIAILTEFFLAKGHAIVILSNDTDFRQLLVHGNVRIYQPKGWEPMTCENPREALMKKVLAGDPTDNVKAVKRSTKGAETPSLSRLSRIANAQMIAFEYIPRSIQDRVIAALGLPPSDMPVNFRPMPVQLGLCCINSSLVGVGRGKRKIHCSRKPKVQTVENKGTEVLLKSCRENLRDLSKLIRWNAEHGIRVFRISSELFPHMSNPKVEPYTMDFAQELLDDIGTLARGYRQRLTLHPGQFDVIGSPNEATFLQTARDLEHHAEILDRLGCDQDGVVVVHGGGIYGDKASTIRRWIDNFRRLPESVRRRLVLENCERCYSVTDCLAICREVDIPMVFDTHHFECYKILHPEERFECADHYIPAILETWKRRRIKPKFHVSEQKEGARIGSHSDYVQTLPEYLLEIPGKYGIDVDIMIEAKMKERAIARLYDRYPQLDPTLGRGFPQTGEDGRQKVPKEGIFDDGIFDDEIFDDEVFDDEVIDDEVIDDEVIDDEVIDDEVIDDEVIRDEEIVDEQ